MATSMSGAQGYRGPTGQASGLRGTGFRQVTTENFTPEQMNLFQQLFGHAAPESFLSKLAGGDQSQFEQLEAPALKQFDQLQGDIASRFSFGDAARGQGQAALGGRHGSAFRNTLNTATQDFAGQLQSQRLNLQRQALKDLLGLSESLLSQKPYETSFFGEQPKQRPFWQELLGGLSGGAVKGLGALI